jgi:hypothetical protein
MSVLDADDGIEHILGEVGIADTRAKDIIV